MSSGCISLVGFVTAPSGVVGGFADASFLSSDMLPSLLMFMRTWKEEFCRPKKREGWKVTEGWKRKEKQDCLEREFQRLSTSMEHEVETIVSRVKEWRPFCILNEDTM